MSRSPRILIANHHTSSLPSFSGALRDRGFIVITTTQLSETLSALEKRQPDIVVLSPLTQDPGGFEVSRVRRVLQGQPPQPLILVLDHLDQLDLPRDGSLPFDDFVRRPASEKELLARVEFNLRRTSTVESLLRERDELERQTITDFKTSLYNDRYFRIRLEEEVQRARRYHLALSCMLMDFDNFKHINDNFDHMFGDFVLLAFAKKLRSVVRDIDIAARFGGDEFGVLLPNTSVDHAIKVAQRIRTIMENVTFKSQGYETGITLSLGVHSIAGKNDIEAEEFLRRADLALIEAKRRGRNRICFYDEIEDL